MSKNYSFKDTTPEFYSKILSVGLDILKKVEYASIEVELPVQMLADKYKMGSKEAIRNKIKELFYFLDATCVLEGGEEFIAVIHVKYEIERDSIRIMYNEKMINQLMSMN